MLQRRHYPKSSGVRSIKKRRAGDRADYARPRIEPGLKPVFRKIGVPEPEPFRPDPFQLEALDLIKDCDVLVSAPTGAGKTWIASQAIHSYLTKGLSVWYASPLKALSNSIYQEFCHEFGASSCGVLTGDRKENPGAPIIVGTTEILRNQLYDTMHKGASIRTDLVVLDEAHYLSDPERGVVWEEALIYLPARVRLLLLSATISNAQEVCAWLRKTRGAPNRVVYTEKRPVTLETLFIFPDGLITSLGGENGLNPKVKKFLASQSGRRRRRPEKIDFGQMIRCLRRCDLLPAIFFLKSKIDCDRALLTCPAVDKSPDQKERLKKAVGTFLKDYPHLEGHRQMKPLLESAVASHHGGQLPYWKVLIEKMMNRGYLEAIFSTSTVAAGVNFPARTVVLLQSDRFNGHEFADLTATEFHQMIGRAGRRGKDQIGFSLIVPGIHQDPQLIYSLKDSPPESISSQIHINFSMTLNLLLSHTPMEVKDLLELSFAAFQEKGTGQRLEERWDRMLLDLEETLRKGKCDTADPYEVFFYVRKRSELQKEIKILTQDTGVNRVQELTKIKESLRSLPCEECDHLRACHGAKKGALRTLILDLCSLESDRERTGSGLWLSFKRHVRFLRETGFVNARDRLTPDGFWASKLRLDQPLLIAEIIRKGTLDDVTPELLAGGLAPFVWDKAQEVDLNKHTFSSLTELEEIFDRILYNIEPIKALKIKRGFESSPILFWPAAALFWWAKGVPWERLLSSLTPVDEGAMASLIMRTADHLRQVVNLRETHSHLASVAERGIELISREPVYV